MCVCSLRVCVIVCVIVVCDRVCVVVCVYATHARNEASTSTTRLLVLVAIVCRSIYTIVVYFFL